MKKNNSEILKYKRALKEFRIFGAALIVSEIEISSAMEVQLRKAMNLAHKAMDNKPHKGK